MNRTPAAGRFFLSRGVTAMGLKGAAVIVGFGMQVILARTLGAEGLGVYATFLALATVLSVTGGLGMPMASVRFLPVHAATRDHARMRGFLHRALRLTVVSSAIIGGALVSVALILPSLRALAAEAVAAALLVPILAFGVLAMGVLQAMGQPLRADLLLNIARPLFIAALVLGSAAAGWRSPALALALTSLGGLLALAAAAAAARRALALPAEGPRDETDRRAWIAAGITYVLAMVVTALIERLDIILLGVIAGADHAGIYSVASRLAVTVGLATAAVAGLVVPVQARQAQAGDREGLQRTAARALALGLSLALMTALLLGGASPWLLPAFGPDFTAAATPLFILLLGQVGIAAIGNASGLLAVAGHNRALVSVALAAVILDIVLCLVLVPLYGPAGAAVATAVTLLAQALGHAAMVRRLLGVDPSLLGALRLALAAGRRAAVTRSGV